MSAPPLIEPIFVPAPHPAGLADEAMLKACRLGRGRGSGPGGQHRNRVQTLVTLTHTSTGIEAHAGERRSAQDNTRVALRRLRLLLAVRARAPVEAAGSRLWHSRVAAGKIACSADHRDYPAMLAEAFDVIYDAQLDIKRASLRLLCSRSQLIRFIAKEPAALVALNEARTAKGQRPMRSG